MQKKNRVMSTLQWIMWLMMVATIVYFVAGELILPSEKMYTTNDCNSYNDGWVHVLGDGTTHTAKVPGECEVEYGEILAIEKILPENQEDTWICIRSSQQDFRIFVGDELREEYSTKNTRPFGKNSVSVYVFFQLYAKDAGRTLRIESVSHSPYSGYINTMYEGERSDIWKHLLTLYLPGTLVAFFMMMLSLAVVIYSNILHYVCKKRMDILYLGSGLMMASIWLLAESRLRQVMLPNSTIASDVGFFVVMLLPYPFLAYINNIQKHRYQKAYMVIAILVIMNFLLSTLLQMLDVLDFSETMGVSHVIIILLIITLFVTVLVDVKKGYIAEYPDVAVGLVGLMLAGIYEIYLVYDKSSLYNGIVLCLGLVFLLLMAGIKTGRDIMNIEREKQKAEFKSESKDKFLANMSHEIRTPINTVIGMNEMILRESKDTSVREYANNIERASRMLLSLINDVLDFSKIEAGKLEIHDNPYQLATVLNDVITGIKVRTQSKDLILKCNIDVKLPSVLKGDEIRVKQILNNLLSNAVKYTDEGSISLDVSGQTEGDIFTLVISVKDTGMGIKKEDMQSLFDSFQRLELQKNQYIEGTGLGLSITRQLIDRMKGSIDVSSEYGKGSCFVVHIPQEIVDAKPIGELEHINERKDVEEETTQEEKQILYAPQASVLVVDDNKMNLTVVKALLKRSAIQLDMAMGGEECLELTRNKKYDVILMDHMMPEPDGVETLHLLRKEDGNPNQNTTVVVLTANAIEGAEEMYMNEGFADYLAKPVVGAKLEEVLSKYL